MRALLLALLVELAEPHAVMTEPTPRSNIVIPANSDCNWVTGTCPIGTKLTSFSDAVKVANRGCGGSANNDPGAAGWLTEGGQMPRPTIVAVAGSFVTVKWALTVPHRADIENSGVRIALHYARSDSFDCNVLAENLRAGPDLPDADVQQTPPLERSVDVEIPPDKVSDHAVLQFLWAAENDGGYYLSCADLAIVDPLSGQKSEIEYAQLPAERGELPVNPQYTRPSSYTCTSNTGGGSDNGGVVATVVILMLLALGAGGYFMYKRNQGGGGGGGGTTYGGAVPPPPGSGGGGLPPGWREVPDPVSGRSYYVNDSTGETTWERPKAGGGSAPPPPPPGAAAPPGLPPGWSAAQDPASGRTYYVHAASGATSWEVPSYA